MIYPHEREVEVFEAALELPPGQRDAFIAQASVDNPELLQRVHGGGILWQSGSRTQAILS